MDSLTAKQFDRQTQMRHNKGLTLDTPARYEIRIQGNLDASWSDRLGGVSIQSNNCTDTAPVTMLSGSLSDQAALVGVLVALYDLGLPLLSVECLEEA